MLAKTLTALRSVDTHAHVMRRDAPLVAHRHSAPARDVTVEEYLAVLDAHGISHGVLTAPSFYGTDNTLLLEALTASGGRLRGTVNVPKDIPASGLRELFDQGVRGIRFNWLRRDALPDASSADYQRLFHAARDCGLHVELFIEGPKLPQVLPHFLKAGADLVLDHFGLPDANRQLECPGFRAAVEAVETGRTWVKLSAPFRLGGVDPQGYVDALMSAGGPERLLWGSDWPWVSHENEVTYQDCVDALKRWVPADKQRNTILRDTPAKLFGFSMPESPSATTQIGAGEEQSHASR